ncbi:MAG: hypothetical protein R6V73_09405 [Anaerolineales bacterium]|jgi:hypothetical protein
MYKSPLFWSIVLLILAGFVTAFAPLEKTLGSNARIVYLHGAWVWVGLVVFAAAALVGLVAILKRSQSINSWSRALGRTAMVFWITFLPMSLYLMSANWNGLFLDEPRWRIPFSFAVTGLLLQTGVSFLGANWASVANIGFAVALFSAMQGMDEVLHPVSPILNSNATSIQVFFILILILLLLTATQISRVWYSLER